MTEDEAIKIIEALEIFENPKDFATCPMCRSGIPRGAECVRPSKRYYHRKCYESKIRSQVKGGDAGSAGGGQVWWQRRGRRKTDGG